MECRSLRHLQLGLAEGGGLDPFLLWRKKRCGDDSWEAARGLMLLCEGGSSSAVSPRAGRTSWILGLARFGRILEFFKVFNIPSVPTGGLSFADS